MRRWRVASDRDVGAARGARAFGSYTFNVSDGRETFPLWYGMTEGYPWSQPVDRARYDALHAGARLRPRDVTVASYPKTGTTWGEQIVLLRAGGDDHVDQPWQRVAAAEATRAERQRAVDLHTTWA